MTSDVAQTLSEKDMLDMGFSPVVHAGQVDMDNPLVEAFLSEGAPQQDREGRQIISWRQFQEMQKRGDRLDNYAMRMYWPGYAGTSPIQATKYHKWYGQGMRAVGDATSVKVVNRLRDALNKQIEASSVPLDEGTELFRCTDKYPTCKRFFDSARGLKFHWQKDHGEKIISTRNRKPNPIKE